MGSGRMNFSFNSKFHGQSICLYHLCCLRRARTGNEELRLTLSVEAYILSVGVLARVGDAARGADG